MSLKTQVGTPAGSGEGAGGRAPRAPLPRGEDPSLLGMFAVGFSLLGIFTFAPVFVPLGLILGIIAVFIGQIGYGITAIVLSAVGVATSPTLLAVVGAGAFFAWLGL